MAYSLYNSDSVEVARGKHLLTKASKNKHEYLSDTLKVEEDGYIEVYLVNETSENVWFDDFTVQSTTPIIVQESHYYPFGSELTGLAYSYNNHTNREKFNGKEFQDELNLDWYDYGARMYDPLLGRWGVVDPMASKRDWVSPYNFVQNNPLSRIDPDGRFDIRIHGENNSSVTVVTDLIDIDINAGGLVGDFGGNYSFQGDDILVAALDIAGIFDPTGAADIAAGSIEMKNGNFWSGMASYAGVAPLIGDVAKLGKVPKHLKTINNAIDATKNRVKLRKGTVEQVKDNAPKNRNGDYLDPNTGQVIPKDDPFDIGHRPGQEWRTRKEMHKQNGSTRKEVLDSENNPNLYQVENPSSNRSRRYEKK
ncbi:RHS repeat-associated core domain-containing protein [Belliella pelovolcani]|uniref:RHS repeat-associated core domain-containing protein n=1 Tax=Belliella pelovolcani TaxID=529505 RepID=A0A1N7Q3B4_9BACT|nr:RHS repeat-associated core domain-containing protein [Belliella pelovolcani]SIT17373.1 RHS repeat-associated core domain-containing protein [Belliella pelovolcani]